jgi:hypothetical protein
MSSLRRRPIGTAPQTRVRKAKDKDKGKGKGNGTRVRMCPKYQRHSIPGRAATLPDPS